MGRYLHAICWPCWDEQNPDAWHGLRGMTGPAEVCCFCGGATTSGVYVRRDPGGLRCKGEHGEGVARGQG